MQFRHPPKSGSSTVVKSFNYRSMHGHAVAWAAAHGWPVSSTRPHWSGPCLGAMPEVGFRDAIIILRRRAELRSPGEWGTAEHLHVPALLALHGPPRGNEGRNRQNRQDSLQPSALRRSCVLWHHGHSRSFRGQVTRESQLARSCGHVM